jgi:histidinol phosphatase-like PHP family hydrolase
MAPRYDFHIHTNLSACGDARMTLEAVVRECERLGHRSIGIADHVNHPDHVAKNAALLGEIRRLGTKVEVYFGTEVNYLPEFGGHPLTGRMKDEFGFQYAIGSHHNLYLPKGAGPEEIVETQHRHHLLTCENPVMDVLGHPYRYLKGVLEACGRPPGDLLRVMPERLVRELGRTAKETRTAVEINALSFLAAQPTQNPYLDGYLALLEILKEEGVTFALGSDAHDVENLGCIEFAWEIVDRLGLGEHRIWRPHGAPASAADGIPSGKR